MNKKTGYFVPITLGTLAAFGPIVTDIYLPAMPEMVDYFSTSPAMLSLSLTAGMIGLAVGQLFIGPLSDKYGRKPLLNLSMLLFALSSVLCIFSPNIHFFNVMRVVQGAAGAGGVALSKSVATDLFTGKQLTDFMALLAAINGISPVFAPILGGAVTNFASWQGVFILLLVIGIILLVCCMRLPETLQPEARSTKNVIRVYGNLFKVFRSRRFTLCTLSQMAAFFTFIAYVSASPFIFQTVYHLTPLEFSICFGLNALMIGVGAVIGPRFHHANTALKWGSIDLLASTILVAVCQFLRLPLAILMPCYIYMLVCFGMMQPVSTAIAMDSQRNHAGAAAAVFGAFQFTAGAIASPLVALGDVMQTSAVIMLVGAVVCVALTLPLCEEVKREGMAEEQKSETNA